MPTPSASRSDRHTTVPRLAAGLIAAGLIATIALLASACGGSSQSGDDPTTTSIAEDTATTIDPLTPSVFTDPSQPVSVGLGRRFELLLPADPTRGWRWVLEPVDTARIIPLSSEFRDDAALLASTSTTTTSPTAQASTATPEPAVTWEPTTTTTVDPDSPEAAPLVQIMQFAGRSLGTTEIRLRYERIGGDRADARTVTFAVSVHANTD
ncbi:MAG: hypothetical protein EBX39_01365 [Actinobacteria bacterium]|nr:hypothetical protein [Actinomycetota bacterium]